ncbi:hypothetical protein L7F22_042597 [Adiantum nelumboides]|nr:hypothetical protein [Adiantum nelumboides]
MKRRYVKCVWVREFQNFSQVLLVSSKDVHFHQLFFQLLINELEQMILEFMQQEGIEEVMIPNSVIVLLLYADDVVLLAHSLADAQKLMIALENFCLHSGSKTKVMLEKTLNEEKPCTVHNKEPLEVVESFKYLGLEVPANHKWKDCAMQRLEAEKRTYYGFENM